MEEATKRAFPKTKTLFLPFTSATLPSGTRNAVHAKRNDVMTQPEVGASIESSFAMAGTATLTVDSEDDVRKAERADTRSTKRLEDEDMNVTVGWLAH
jgi:hypothetical protein